MWHRSLLIALLLQPGAGPSPERLVCPTVPQHLEGRMAFRGDVWPMRLHLPSTPAADGEATVIDLDLPDLLMAGRPTPVRCSDGSLLLELPFGFGEVALTAGPDDHWSAAGLVAGDSIRLTLREGPPRPYRIEKVTITNGADRLNGQLFLPSRTGRSAGIVVVHGSGRQGLDMIEYRSWGDFYARLGVATLVYDKRGVGGSTGDFAADSAFEALTRDALAAVELLRTRPEVDPARVGIAGHSQAGWIAFRAAARSPSVAFLSLLAAPTVSVAEQELQRVRYGMERGGFEPEAVRGAGAHTRLLFAVAAGADAWDALARSNEAVEGQPWAEWVHRPAARSDLRWWRTHAGVDPEPDLRRLQIPIFAAFSLDDPVVPALENAGLLRELAAARPGLDITVVTVDGGNHRLELPAGTREDGRWYLPRVHRDFLTALERWVRWRLP